MHCFLSLKLPIRGQRVGERAESSVLTVPTRNNHVPFSPPWLFYDGKSCSKRPSISLSEPGHTSPHTNPQVGVALGGQLCLQALKLKTLAEEGAFFRNLFCFVRLGVKVHSQKKGGLDISIWPCDIVQGRGGLQRGGRFSL